MFGLEKKVNPVFEFDLEKQLKTHPHQLQELLQTVEKKIQSIKSQIREGLQGFELDQLGTLLQGYVSLHKIIKRISFKK